MLNKYTKVLFKLCLIFCCVLATITICWLILLKIICLFSLLFNVLNIMLDNINILHFSITINSVCVDRSLLLHSQLVPNNTSVPQTLHWDKQLQFLPWFYLIQKNPSQIISTEWKKTCNLRENLLKLCLSFVSF